MKKLMNITLIVALKFLVLNFSVTNLYPTDATSQGASYRQPASASTGLTNKKAYAFQYKDLTKKPFQIKKEALTYEEAFKSASRECFQQLTGGKYPGEEKGLDIIDICANPKI